MHRGEAKNQEKSRYDPAVAIDMLANGMLDGGDREIADLGERKAMKSRLQFSTRSLLIAVCAVAILAAVASRYSDVRAPSRNRRAAWQARSYLYDRGWVFTEQADAPPEVVDELRGNPLSVRFVGNPTRADFEHLAKLPNLVFISIGNSPDLDEASFEALADLPNLNMFVLENTGIDELARDRILKLNPNWNVFLSREEMIQRQLKRLREAKTPRKSGSAN